MPFQNYVFQKVQHFVLQTLLLLTKNAAFVLNGNPSNLDSQIYQCVYWRWQWSFWTLSAYLALELRANRFLIFWQICSPVNQILFRGNIYAREYLQKWNSELRILSRESHHLNKLYIIYILLCVFQDSMLSKLSRWIIKLTVNYIILYFLISVCLTLYNALNNVLPILNLLFAYE